MNAMTKRVFLRAADIVAQSWCQGSYALDAEGHACETTSLNAVRWCAWGALEKAQSELDVPFAYGGSLDPREMADASTPDNDLVVWNDEVGRTAQQVEALFRKLGSE